MASSPDTAQPPSDLARLVTILGRLSILGALGLALYLGITSLMNGAIAGCTEGGGCHAVVASKWGYFLGIPVSLLGAATYIALLASDWKGCCASVHALCRWMILVAVAWFVGVQAFILKEFCPWCCITHFLAVLGVLLLWKKGAPQVKWMPIAGLAGIAGLALVQAFGPERATTAGGSLAEGQGTQIQEATPTGPRVISLHGGDFQIPVADFPSIGDPSKTKNVAVGLFDFTCPHCQHLHETLTALHEEFRGQFAVVQLPGYYAPKGKAIHKQMMAVWNEDRESYHQLAELLHEGSLKAVETEVQTAIAALVGPDEHRAWQAKHDTSSEEILATNSKIREANRAILKTGKFPQLMIGDYVEAGHKTNKGHYYDLFKEKFGLVRLNIPKLVVEPKTINLGQIYAGTVNALSIKVSNPGGHTVTLARPEVERGMRIKPGYPTTLESGASGLITVEAVPGSSGPMNGKITVLSDAEPGRVVIPVTAEVSLPYKVEPPMLDLGLYKGTPLTQSTTISFDSPVQLGPPRSNNPTSFAVTMKELQPNLSYELTVTATPNTRRAGVHQAMIQLVPRPLKATKPWPKTIRINARCRMPTQARPPAPPQPQRTGP